MLTIVHLSHLQNEFQIQRLLEKSEPTSASVLLSVSANIVSTVVQLGKSRDKAVLLRQEFPYVVSSYLVLLEMLDSDRPQVVNYGLPSAATLAAALHTGARNRTQSFPQGLSRSALIRSLMAFVSFLESIGDEGEVVHATCVQAAHAISRTLDDVLNHSPSTSGVAPSIPTPGPPPVSNDAFDVRMPFSPSQLLPIDPALDFDLLNTNALDGFDLSGWLNTVSWNGDTAS
jgi:hypothetical protein